MKNLVRLESDILARMHPNSRTPLYFYLSEKLEIDPRSFAEDCSKEKYFPYLDIESPELNILEEHFYKLADDIQVSIPHMLPQDIQIIFDYGQAIAATIDNYNVCSSREWRELNWYCRYDAFDSEIIGNRIQFKLCGSTPFELLEPWIFENKITCDIANVNDDFEYWSFASYQDGVRVKFEDTLDSGLLKVLMMIEEEKPTAERFKQIHRDCYEKKIPKQLLTTYLNGEAYPHI